MKVIKKSKQIEIVELRQIKPGELFRFTMGYDVHMRLRSDGSSTKFIYCARLEDGYLLSQSDETRVVKMSGQFTVRY